METMISHKIRSHAVELRAIVDRVMSAEDVERAIRSINAIIAESERVEGLEGAVLKPEAR
ncbi:multi-sensor signal transduction histidine kinase [Desulfarculus baarsii DSM 2075]|uniref:Multi-sensor signal transduction histidine kinase n=1 Tax=Desulfarculus baarsii (strain ATCC 33931 / DSM 2075 / LMG 7858 / VKM B-1802 / 2st14) TaxID=644282 RepID=E1QHD1_DESB2|nr:hypothetical protein [Desulfarculus baarsii]ADK84974.1 multi-sensor signal transduction histidine kinase [Desulfarculus baarsii DSM 2075]